MPSDYILANTNGRLHSADEPSISPLNRGFLYGDAVYEVWRTYHGVIFAFDEHWQRLERSASALFFALPLTQEALRLELLRTAREFRKITGAVEELYLRLQVTRGGGVIGLDPALADKADYVILVQLNKGTSAEKLRSGLKLSVARTLRRNPKDSMNPAWKTGNYLNNLLCLREVRARGADEAVILNHDGEITEAAVCNLAFVREGKWYTPSIECGILEGITRALIVRQTAAMAGISVLQVAIRPEELSTFSEAMLLSTTRDVAPVSAIDGTRFDVGPSATLWKLKKAFELYTATYAQQHPELKV